MRSAHVGFTVSDLDAGIRAFTTLFGYALHDRGGRHQRGVELLTGVPGADIEVAHLRAHGLIDIELIAYRSPADAGLMTGRPCDTGHSHITYEVEDIATLVETAATLGFEVAGRIVRTARIAQEGQQVVYLRNGDGLTIELIQPPASFLS
jgi:glyoxylase I family protein